MPAMISSPVSRFVSRYNSLYITKFRYDTGGLQFPTAIDQLFTGLHSLEVYLAGQFFLVRDESEQIARNVTGLRIHPMGLCCNGYEARRERIDRGEPVVVLQILGQVKYFSGLESFCSVGAEMGAGWRWKCRSLTVSQHNFPMNESRGSLRPLCKLCSTRWR
jgi:hypothetical protein